MKHYLLLALAALCFFTLANADQTGLITKQSAHPPKETIDRLDDIRLPATVDIYVAPFCPHCPGVVLQLFPLALANSRILLAST